MRSKDGAGYLIDFKSAKRIEPARMLMVLRQVLTYALMDERDEYEIRRVGFYFTRYGVWAHWGFRDCLILLWAQPPGNQGNQGNQGTWRTRRQWTHTSSPCGGSYSTYDSPRPLM